MAPLTPEERAAVLHERREMARATVASVLVQPNSSKDVLTDAQRARTSEVKAILERGENPFALEELKKRNKDLVGSTRAAIASHRDMPDYKVKELEDKWARKNNPAIHKTKTGIDLRKKLPVELQVKIAIVKDPAKIYCSYCDVEVQRISATEGTGKVHSKVETTLINGEIVETVKRWVDKIIACPQCVLNIEPQLDKDGNLIKSGIKFPELQG